MPRRADPALPERRRGQILDAARACFRERGFRQTTIEEICAEARISPGALYRYYNSKADIVAAIALEARADAEAALERLGGEASLIDGLTDLARAFFEAFDRAGDGALLSDIWAEAARDCSLAAALGARDRVAVGRISGAIERAQAVGLAYPALEPEDAARTLMAALDGFALRRALWRDAGAGEAARRFRALALQILKPKR
ncbi:MAG TPA: helix-turn-helix domain-containing protein [Vitreimonas sp.]|uniref:TetR/AcrR family transcriptional regulator n=1 Tax=Vitreimonas sp. TaxID=3069702 RepID=UPI002D53DA22|nr:helix-turn-helix domain-containing protein [Vitreimonas sp.]HYD88231.1 helix-turn-helix domain-containing protein [Vitreimonas sp.]